MTKQSKFDPGPRSTPAKAQKDDAAALAWLEVEGRYNRKRMIERIRANPPSAEIIAALAFARKRVVAVESSSNPHPKSCIDRIRVLGVTSLCELEEMPTKGRTPEQRKEAKSLLDYYRYNRQLLSNSISKVKRAMKEKQKKLP